MRFSQPESWSEFFFQLISIDKDEWHWTDSSLQHFIGDPIFIQLATLSDYDLYVWWWEGNFNVCKATNVDIIAKQSKEDIEDFFCRIAKTGRIRIS